MIIVLSFIFVSILCILLYYLRNNDKRESFDDNNSLPTSENKTEKENKQEILVSLTTSPRRIEHIEPVLDSIMKRTMKPDKIILNLPYVFKRNNTIFEKIPSFITSNKMIHVNRCEDIGPITKILPTIQIAKDMDSIIISIDDDIIYPDYFIEKLIKKAEQYPHCVITGSGSIEYRNRLFEIAEGYAGNLYRKKFLIDFPVHEIPDYPKACYLGDDLIISNFLAKKFIPIISLKEDELRDALYNENRILPYSNESDALHLSHQNNNSFHGHDYRTCVEYLKTKNNYNLAYLEKHLH